MTLESGLLRFITHLTFIALRNNKHNVSTSNLAKKKIIVISGGHNARAIEDAPS